MSNKGTKAFISFKEEYIDSTGNLDFNITRGYFDNFYIEDGCLIFDSKDNHLIIPLQNLVKVKIKKGDKIFEQKNERGRGKS
jgi:hypothetical protein